MTRPPEPEPVFDVKLRLMGSEAACRALLERLGQVVQLAGVEGPVPNRRGAGVRFYAVAVQPRDDE